MTISRVYRYRSMAVVGAVVMALTGVACTGGGSSTDESLQVGDHYVTEEVSDGTTTFVRVTNPQNGQTITYSPNGSTGLVEATDGDFTYAFKDMNGNGVLDASEDWRNDCSVRAEALVTTLSTEQLSGLMLFSAHQRDAEAGMTEEQKQFLSDDRIRNVLASTSNDVNANVTWTNAMQAYAETLGTEDEPYLPINFSSDPRSSTGSSSYTENAGVYFPEAGTGKTISLWPSNLGLAATHDADLVGNMAEMVSEEYRALGIQMALGPQVDLVTDPRNLRNNGMFGEDVDMASAMADAYVEGFQNTYDDNGESQGWGEDSVVTTLKHFPGDGAGEGGREGHNDWGKYVVYPGGNEMESVKVFQAASDTGAVMMSYSVGVAADGTAAFGEELVGSAYDSGKVNILREDNDYDGVIMTDWAVTTGSEAGGQKDFGVEDLSVEEQHYKILRAGVDMFGGNNSLEPVMAAYDLWQADYEAGENAVDAETRWEETGARILTMMCNTGTFDNPYTDLEDSLKTAGSSDKIEAGIEAQLGSVVMLKNDGVIQGESTLEDWSDKKVYIPNTYSNAFNMAIMDNYFTEGPTLDVELAEKYFGEVVTDTAVLTEGEQDVDHYEVPDISDVDMVLVSMSTPNNGGMPGHGYDSLTEEYRPVSLQYDEYVADGENVRQVSIAGDVSEDGTKENRSYYGKTSHIENHGDIEAFNRAVEAVEASGRDIPIVTIIQTSETGSVIPAEFEADSDVIFIGYEVAEEAYFQLALGLAEPSARLPLGLPADMKSVEGSYEDVAKDVESYTDSVGNTYEYGFGLDWGGAITDD